MKARRSFREDTLKDIYFAEKQIVKALHRGKRPARKICPTRSTPLLCSDSLPVK